MNRKMKGQKKSGVVWRWVVASVAPALSCVAMTMNAMSFNEALYYNNNILFYDECGDDGVACGGDIEATEQNDRLREVVEKYGELAMDLQRKYGVPWELVFTQMVAESGVGANNDGIAGGVAEEFGGYNWLGLTFSDYNLYDTGEYYTTFTKWSVYSSIANMIASYFVDFMRNGYYDAGFQYTDPNNYSFEGFIRAILPAYCSEADNNGDGQPDCNHDQYVRNVMASLEIVHEVSEKQGWPTSAELQKNENIAIGGEYPVDGNIRSLLNAEAHSLYIDCSGTSSGVSSSSDVKWEDGWIVSGMSGYHKDSAEEASKKDGWTMDGTANAAYKTDSGRPNSILLHSTEGSNQGGGDSVVSKIYPSHNGQKNPPHFTIDLVNKEVWQHFSIDGASTAITGDPYVGVQIEIIGFSGSDCNYDNLCLQDYGDEEWQYLATLLHAISNETGVPLTTDLDWENPVRFESKEEMAEYVGVMGHMHAYNNDHTDPGNIWPQLAKAIQATATDDGCVTDDDGGLKSGGMTLAEAQEFMKEYIALAQYPYETETVYIEGTDTYLPKVSCAYGTYNNCSAFSTWFVATYTTITKQVVQVDGQKMVDQLVADFPEYMTKSDIPKAYSVFSTVNDQHTGVVLGVDVENNTMVIGEAGCGLGPPDWPHARELSIDAWDGNHVYAQIDDSIMKY